MLNAEMLITLTEVGANIKMTITGTVDPTGLAIYQNIPLSVSGGQIKAASGFSSYTLITSSKDVTLTSYFYEIAPTATVPFAIVLPLVMTNLGLLETDSGSGHPIGITDKHLILPTDHNPSFALPANEAIFENQSLVSLGIVQQTDSTLAIWGGSGDQKITFTAIPEPSTILYSVIPLFAIGLLLHGSLGSSAKKR